MLDVIGDTTQIRPTVIRDDGGSSVNHDIQLQQEYTDNSVVDVSDDEESASSETTLEESKSILSVQRGVPVAVHVQDSRDVQVGPRLCYNNPVTINQFLRVTQVRNDQDYRNLLSLELARQVAETSAADPDNINVSVNLLNNETEANHSQVSQIQQSSPKQSQTNIITAKKRVLTRFLWVVFIILLLVGISLIITLVLQTQRRHQSTLWSDPIELPGKHFIFSKRLWKGVNATSTEPLEHPTPIVVISHTRGRRCNSFEDCSDVMRNTQDHHLSLRGQRSGDKVVDIGYNFLIGGDGNIYEGRGWDVRSFHRRPENVIGISFIGNYERFELTEHQIEAAQELLALGVKEQKLTTDYALVAHSQTIQTTSPGQNVVKVISKWSHWSPHLQIR